MPAAKFPLFNEAKPANRVQSWVWDHFKSINTRQGSNGDEKMWGRDHEACNLCHEAALKDSSLKWAVSYGEAKSTGHLSRHLDTYHPEVVEANNKKEAASKQGGNIQNYLSSTVSFGEKFMDWVVESYQPISICESESFRAMMKSVNKDCPNLDSKSIMAKLKKREQKARLTMKEYLKDRDVSITLDHWTSAANVNYVAQTAHFIDHNFEIVKLTLACSQHKGSQKVFLNMIIAQMLDLIS